MGNQEIISKTAEKRNAFIHYKFIPIDISDETHRDNEMDDIEKARLTATYIKRYESRVLYAGRKGAVEKKSR